MGVMQNDAVREDMSMYKVIISPQWQKLKEEVERLKATLILLVMERDELEQVVCHNLETDYMMKLGDLEYKVYQAMCMYRRAKRKSELIRKYINMGMLPDMQEIEAQLDIELAEYERILEEKMKKMNEAIEHHRGRALSLSEEKELKQLYRKIVKQLHPDLNPGVTEEQLRLYMNAVEAYRNGDLGTLRIIELMCAEQQNVLPDISVKEQKEHLLEAIERVKEDIEEIKSRFPYTAEELLQDKEEITRRREQMQKQINDYKAQAVKYENSVGETLN